jgi:hypothetical protein
MKKIVCIFLILFSFLSVSYAQSYIIGVPELQGSPKYLKTYSERLTAQQRYIKTDTLAKYVADYVLSDSSIFHRNNHTGSQLISTIKNLQTSLDGKLSLMSEKLRINGLGNVGIGTVNPLLSVDVRKTSPHTYNRPSIGGMSPDGNTHAYMLIPPDGTSYFDIVRSNNTDLRFATETSLGVGFSTQATLTSTGRLGIKTLIPSHDLHVNGTSRTDKLLVNTGVDNGVDVGQFNGSVNIAGALKSVGTHTITSSSTSDDATLTLYQSGSNYWHIKNVAPSGQLHFVRGTSTFGRINQAGQWSIGQNEVANTAILDVQSTTKGFLPPRMTTAQRNAIASPAEGLMIYQTDNTKGWYGYNGSAWVQL